MTTKEQSLYEQLSEERKALQQKGDIPDWVSTGGWQMFKGKYLYGVKTWKEQYQRIAETAAKHTENPAYWEPKFFEILWKGWLSPSTPILANMGTDRGLCVSCSGTYIEDSVQGFYEGATEIAVLSKWGFGTSGYLGDIRPRGSKISRGGKASGVLPVIKNLVQVCRDISQGGTRRGSGGWYVNIESDDFWEVLGHLEAYPDDLNIGWNIHDSFIQRLNEGDEDALARFQASLKVKMTLGKGYYEFIDKVNRQRPDSYVKNNLFVKASNLCNEIQLFSDKDHTFTCVLSSMVVAKWDEWKDTDAVYTATVFLDCVASEFVNQGKNIPWLEKSIRFTEKGRALGLGQMGLFSLFQKKLISAESFEAHSLNNIIAKHIHDESLKASQWMAKEWGEPEWCKGLGVRNTHRIAIAPTKSTALIQSGWTEGINPDPAMAFSASGSAGDIDRVNPVLLDVIKGRGLNVDQCIKEVLSKDGSVQDVSWLDEEEKAAFKTAFEIDQSVLIRLAANRQRWVDQGQSLNLFFAHNDDESYIARVHQEAFENENILGLYYVYSSSAIKADRTGECEACQ